MIWSWFTSLPKGTLDVISSVAEVGKSMVKGVVNVGKSVVKGVVNVGKKVVDAVGDVVEEVVDTVGDVVSTAADIFLGEDGDNPYEYEEVPQNDAKTTLAPVQKLKKRPQISMVIFQHVSYFNFDSFGTILFNFWDYNSIGDIALSCLGILAMTFLMESIQFIREINRTKQELKHPPVPLKKQLKMKLHVDILDAFLHFLYLGLGGLLFLVMLTYHVVLYLAVILGIAFSHGFYRLICPNLKKISFFA